MKIFEQIESEDLKKTTARHVNNIKFIPIKKKLLTRVIFVNTDR